MKVLLICFTLLCVTGCRTIKKSSASTDSSSVKTDQSISKYAREIVTEYLRDTTGITINVAAPIIPKNGQPYVIRQTIRESGEDKKDTKEEVQVSEVVKDKEANVPVLLQYSAIMLAGAVLLFAIGFIIKQFR